MPRKKRIWYPGAVYHVMSRGNRRSAIFKDDSDYLDFLEILDRARERFGFKIHSICLMTNHFHFILETQDVELWRIMHLLLLSYASDYNSKYKLTGHLFENRYTAKLIDNDRYFLEVSRYIHLNPVMARIVTNPLEYAYSSYGKFLNEDESAYRWISKCTKKIYDMTDISRVLSYFPDDPHEQYRIFVEGQASHEEHELLIRKDMHEDDIYI